MTAALDEGTAAETASAETPFRRFIADFFASRLATVGLVLLVAVIFVAVFAPLISPQNPYDLAALDLLDGRLPPGSQSPDGLTYWLGTDDQIGRAHV